MKRFLHLIIAVAVLTFAISAQKPDSSAKPDPKPTVAGEKLPEAKEVIDRYVKAIGGREAFSKHKSRYQTGTIELSPMGLKGTVESFSRSDNRSLTKVTIDGVGDLLDGFDGSSGWVSNPVQGIRKKEGRELQQAKRNSTFAREVNLEKMYSSLRVRGVEKVGERDTYVVVASSTDGLPDDILYFDTENGLMLRSDSIVISPEGDQATSTFYEDYREVDGVKTAFKVRGKTPAFEINTIVTEVKYGVAIEDSRFVMPK